MGRGACFVTPWLDSAVIHMVLSSTGQSPEDVANRWVKKEKTMVRVQKPFSVALYNQHMGEVDLVDQCLAKYPHRRRNKRRYIQVFFHVLDATVGKDKTPRLQSFCSLCSDK